MNANLRQFQAFVTVARLGNFTRAAKHLHLSQPALTVQIRQLEEAMGVRLFDRSTRMVKPTPIGRELVPTLERVLHEIDAVMVNTKELASHVKGTVTIGALPSISSKLIPSAIAEFQKQYPGIVVRLRDVLAYRNVRLVKEEEVDFGIGTLRMPDPDIHFTPLLTDHLGVIFPTGHPVERQRTITLKYLTAFPLILMDPETSVRDLVEHAFESIGVSAVPAFESVYPSVALALVKAGLGITIQPSSSMELASSRGLKFRTIRHQGLTREIGVIQNVRRSLSPSAEAFIQMMKAVCKSLKS
jgi:LysR family transcriptional regulator, carnitine catabolism transcriptional activator